MKFQIKVDDRTIKCAMTGKTARIYREQFQRDLLFDISEGFGRVIESYAEFSNSMPEEATDDAFLGIVIRAVSPVVLERMLWASIASADENVLAFNDWLDQIDDYENAMAAAATAFLTMRGSIKPIESIEVNDEQDDEIKKKA